MSEGWTWLQNSKVWHYFGEDRRSLCGKFLGIGIKDDDIERGNNDSADNCQPCRRKLQKLTASGAKESGNG